MQGFPLLFATCSLKNLGFCFLLEIHAEKHDGTWYSCYILVDGWCNLPVSSTRPQFPGISRAALAISCKVYKAFSPSGKIQSEYFHFFFKGDLGVLMKKKSNCVVRVSLRTGMLPVSSPQSVAASPCTFPLLFAHMEAGTQFSGLVSVLAWSRAYAC